MFRGVWQRLAAIVPSSLVLGTWLAIAPNAYAAEQLTVTTTQAGQPLQVSVPVADLETFARTGEASPAVNTILAELDPAQVAQLRQLLIQPVQMNPTTLDRFTAAPMVQTLLSGLGQTFRTSTGANGGTALQNAFVLAAADEDGFTLINVMQEFPDSEIQVSLDDLVRLVGQWTTRVAYREAAMEAIAQQAQQESTLGNVNFGSLPDLRQPGRFTVQRDTRIVRVRADVRPTDIGFVSAYDFAVDLYWPAERTTPAPVVVLTHGFGANRENYAYYAEHLTSHGFAVAAPEHIGSNLQYRQEFLAGELPDLLSPVEYLSRSYDISNTLDDLEELVASQPEWAARLDLENVGVFGNSLGGSTALSVAGATLDTARLQQQCTDANLTLNLAYVLQCPARHLPPVDYDLRDERIDGAIAAYPLTNALFGPAGMADLDIPTLLFSGSHDVIAPPVQEQVEPFLWLQAPDQYLALIGGGTHFSTSDDAYITNFPGFLKPPSTALGRDYLQGLSVAFFRHYLENDTAALAYLSSDYARFISTEAMPLYLVQTLTANQIASALGRPFPPTPTPIPIEVPPAVSTLDDIRRTGELRVALRSDAPPFGYLDADGNWDGYCFDLLDTFAAYLEEDLQRDIQVVRFPSDLENRFTLVQQDVVQVECGPNTIRPDVDGVLFSQPFFYTGTRLLREGEASPFENRTLAGLDIGLLPETTTDRFIRRAYPRANPVPFPGVTGRTDAVQAVAAGELDAFASDEVLLLGELARLNLPAEDFTLFPNAPLTCDGYGLILPGGDTEWQSTVSAFLRDQAGRDIQRIWFSDFLPSTLETLAFCLGQADPR